MPPLDPVRALFGPRFEELAGARAAGEVPLSERVINRVIAERLAASHGRVEGVEVRLHETGELTARVRLRSRLMPPLTVAARVHRQPELPHAPLLVLRWWLPGPAAITALAGRALALIGATPAGIRVDADLITFDLARLLAERGAGEALDYLKSLHIELRARAVLVRFEVRVGERGERPI